MEFKNRDELKGILMGYVDGSLKGHLDFDKIIDDVIVSDDCFVFRFPNFKLFLKCSDLSYYDVWVE